VEPQRESVPAPEIAPAAAGPAAPAAAAMGFGPGSMTPAAVLALQRSAGNSAVSSMLMRQDKTPVTGAADFGISGGEPQASGTVTARPVAGDMVRVESPDVKFSQASVWLQDDKTLQGSQNFGFIQNLVSSDRGTVYRRGGDPAGEFVAEMHDGHGKAWDAVSGDKDGEVNKGVFAPFYWPPSTITDENVSGDPAKTDPAAHDQPGVSMPAEHEGGRVTEFKGEDKFKLGVGVKKGDAVHMLKAHDWSVPWAVQVGKDLNGAGKAIASSPVQDALRDGPDPSLKNWSLEKGSGQVWEGFATPEEANKRTASQLLDWLLIAKDHDPVSYQNICAALDSKAADVKVTVTCDTTHANFSNDAVSLQVLRDGTLIRTEGGLSMNNGDTHTMSLGWGEAFGSAANIKGGMVLKVEAFVTGNNWEIGHGFMPPFKGSSPQLTPGDGKYHVSVAI
jgi:hypothetical protein